MPVSFSFDSAFVTHVGKVRAVFGRRLTDPGSSVSIALRLLRGIQRATVEY